MADVFSTIILDNNYWDGTTSWANEVSEAARDSKYSTRRFTSLSAWEADRDGNANADDIEYANIFGPWASHDTVEFVWGGWANTPTCIVQTIGTDARSQDGKFDSNSCYVLENNGGALRCIDFDQDGFDITFIGVQVYESSDQDQLFLIDNDINFTIDKCYFKTSFANHCIIFQPAVAKTLKITNTIFAGGSYGVYQNNTNATLLVYNCTTTGQATDGLRDKFGTSTAKNCAIFNTSDDFQDVDTVDYCASDDQDGTNSQNLGGDAAGWNAAFTDYANGDFTIKDTNSVLYQTGESHTNDANVPTDDIIGNARVDGSESIGAYEYIAGGETFYKTITGSMPNSVASVVLVSAYKQTVEGNIPNPVAIIIKQISTQMIGVVPAPVATVIKKTSKQFVGEQPASTGNVVCKNVFKQSATGNTPNPVGNLVSFFNGLQAAVGNMPTSVGVIVKRIGKYLVGSQPTSQGVIVKNTGKYLTGNQPSATGSVKRKTTTKKTGIMGAISGAVSSILNPVGPGIVKLYRLIGSSLKKFIG